LCIVWKFGFWNLLFICNLNFEIWNLFCEAKFMQYSVPQFIDKEKTLLGPLTVRQTVILGTTAITLGIAYVLFNFFIFSILVVLLGSFGIVLAFVRINDRPFHEVITGFLNYFIQPRTYFWQKQQPKPLSPNQARKIQREAQEQVYVSYQQSATSQNQASAEQFFTSPKDEHTSEHTAQAQSQPEQTKEEEIKRLAEFLDRQG
jgi:hypothetical protein